MGRKKCLLLVAIRKAILPLNNTLPEDIACIWVTPEELHERLVRAGVSKTLNLSLVVDAIRRNNPDCCLLAKCHHNSVNYYRCQASHLSDMNNSCPATQRFKKGASYRQNRMQTCTRNYFVQNASDGLTLINESLAKLEQKKKQQINDERGEYIYQASILFCLNLSMSF